MRRTRGQTPVLTSLPCESQKSHSWKGDRFRPFPSTRREISERKTLREYVQLAFRRIREAGIFENFAKLNAATVFPRTISEARSAVHNTTARVITFHKLTN